MKIKWNWGTGLFIAASVFMLFIIGFVYFMFQENFDLVEKDYYPKGLVYQQRIDKQNNSALLSEKVNMEIVGQEVLLSFPDELNPDSLSGIVTFYRPSGESGDVNVPINADTAGVMLFPVSKLIKGNYVVKIDYSYLNKGYYQEESLYVP